MLCLHLQIGVSSVWYEGNPCNMHLLDLAAEVKAGIEQYRQSLPKNLLLTQVVGVN